MYNNFQKTSGYSNRVSALNQGTVNLMHSIGVWNKITQIRFKPVRQLQVFDINGTNINFMNETTEPVAYIVENDVILDALYNQLKELPNVKILNEVRVKNCKLPSKLESKALVELNTGKILSCNLLVGADGHNSLVRKEMQSSHINISYNQMGVVATLTLSEATPNDTAWQRFLPNGPVAMLPLTNDLSSLVWTTTPEHAKELLKMDTQHFVDSLNDAFYRQYKQSSIVKVALQGIESFLGSDINTSVQYPPRVKKLINKSRAAFPLGFSHVSQYIARGAAIVGDAAHRIHPLAGQGVNLGFDDAKSLSEILGAACYRGAWLGEQNHLLMYERERLRKNLPIMLGVHGLQRLYQAENNPIVALRTIGLKVIMLTYIS